MLARRRARRTPCKQGSTEDLTPIAYWLGHLSAAEHAAQFRRATAALAEGAQPALEKPRGLRLPELALAHVLEHAQRQHKLAEVAAVGEEARGRVAAVDAAEPSTLNIFHEG